MIWFIVGFGFIVVLLAVIGYLKYMELKKEIADTPKVIYDIDGIVALIHRNKIIYKALK